MRISDWSSDVCSSDLALGRRTRNSIVGPVDRALGFGFGALKGLILASLLFLLAVLVLDTTGGGPTERPDWLTQSRSYPLLNATSASIADFVDRRRHGEPVFGRHRDDGRAPANRSEEHTSELRSLMRISYAVFCLKKKNTTSTRNAQL